MPLQHFSFWVFPSPNLQFDEPQKKPKKFMRWREEGESNIFHRVNFLHLLLSLPPPICRMTESHCCLICGLGSRTLALSCDHCSAVILDEDFYQLEDSPANTLCGQCYKRKKGYEKKKESEFYEEWMCCTRCWRDVHHTCAMVNRTGEIFSFICPDCLLPGEQTPILSPSQILAKIQHNPKSQFIENAMRINNRRPEIQFHVREVYRDQDTYKIDHRPDDHRREKTCVTLTLFQQKDEAILTSFMLFADEYLTQGRVTLRYLEKIDMMVTDHSPSDGDGDGAKPPVSFVSFFLLGYLDFMRIYHGVRFCHLYACSPSSEKVFYIFNIKPIGKFKSKSSTSNAQERLLSFYQRTFEHGKSQGSVLRISNVFTEISNLSDDDLKSDLWYLDQDFWSYMGSSVKTIYREIMADKSKKRKRTSSLKQLLLDLLQPENLDKSVFLMIELTPPPARPLPILLASPVPIQEGRVAIMKTHTSFLRWQQEHGLQFGEKRRNLHTTRLLLQVVAFSDQDLKKQSRDHLLFHTVRCGVIHPSCTHPSCLVLKTHLRHQVLLKEVEEMIRAHREKGLCTCVPYFRRCQLP